MKWSGITIGLCFCLFMPTRAQAQKTEVSVHRGKVRAATPIARADINAGRKALISPDGKPVITVSEPLVDDVIKLYRWVQEEKKAQRQRIDTFNITVQRVDDEETTVIAGLTEWKNQKTVASKTFFINMGLQEDLKVYDLDGNLLPVEVKKLGEKSARYTITHTQSVAPGENFRFIGVSSKSQHVDIDAQGVRHQRQAWNVPYCLNFYRVILPPTAIFVESSRPVIAVETLGERVAVTCRAYTGPLGDGKFHFAYLWPEKDNTNLTDIPGPFRGLSDPQKEAIDEEYRVRTAAIISGQAVHDQSTPLLAMLSLYSAATLQNKQQLIDLIGNPEIKDTATKYTDEVFKYMKQGLGTYVFLSTPPYPERPQHGDKHPIHLCRRGSLLHEATVEMAFRDGKWTFWNYEVVWTSKQQQESRDDSDRETPDGETIATLQANGYLTNWEVAGPYTKAGIKAIDLLDTSLGPELSTSDITWRPISIQVTELDGHDAAHINLKQQLNGDPRQVAYLRTTIQSDRNQSMRLDIRSDDAVKAWLNGELIHANNTMRGIDKGPDALVIDLKKGANELLLKVTQDLFGWGAVVQLGSDRAVCPQPHGNVVHPKAQLHLQWTPAVTARRHHVYFGTDRNNLPLLAEVSAARDLRPLSLEAGLRYYWKVDEVLDDGSIVKGDLWHFTAGKQLGWWTFDGDARDRSPQALHGMRHGHPQWVPGVRNQALSLEKEEDYIVIPPLNLNADTMTITLWVKTEEEIDNPGLVFTRDSSTSAGFWIGGSNDLRYNWNDDRVTWLWDSNLFIPNKTWTFAALVVEPEQATIYMHDGRRMTSATHIHPHGETGFDGKTTIGHDPRWGTVKGAIDDMRIYNYALDAKEIKAIYSQTK